MFFILFPLTEISKLINGTSDAYCSPDPIHTALLKKCTSVLLPTITNDINLSCLWEPPDQFKSNSVHPLLKKPGCDEKDLSNNRPISHLSFLLKLTEWHWMHSWKSPHWFYLSNFFQLTYTKFRYTETAFLAVHDSNIWADSQQHITCSSWSFCCLWQYWVLTILHFFNASQFSSWFGLLGLLTSLLVLLCPN